MAGKGELSEDEPPVESVRYLLLSGLPDGTTADGLEGYLSSSFDQVNSVAILGAGTARAEVIDDIEVIQEYLKEKHKIKKQQISIILTDPPDPPDPASSPKAATPSAALDYYPDLIEVTCDDDIETDRLQMYFESKRSGGKKEKTIEHLKKIDEGVIHVKFESAEDAAAVVAQKKHSITKNKKPYTFEVRYVPVPPKKEYDKSKLLIKDIPEGTDEEYVSMHVENCLGLEEDDFTIDLRSGVALLLLESTYTDEELNEMVKKLGTKKLKKKQLTVERCEVNYSIIITGITKKTFATEDGLEMYFENSRSGGGEDIFLQVEFLAKGKAKVTFNDHSVIQRVLKKKHSKLGPSVNLTECSVLDSLEVSSDEDEYESAEEETFKKKLSHKRDKKTGEKPSKGVDEKNENKSKKKLLDSSSDDDKTDVLSPLDPSPPCELPPAPPAPIIPMNPIPHPLDPLLAKYIRLKPDVTKGIEKEYQVTLTADDGGIITISPTHSSPPDWPVKGVKMMQDFILSSLTKVDIPVPLQVSDTVYPMVMKACNDEGLQFAFGQGDNKVAIAGHVDAVTKLQQNISEICGRMIQITDKVELSHEDYCYLKGYMLPCIQQRHSAVKLQCHDDHLSLSVNGSIKDVNEVKDKLPQYLVHKKFPVNLEPVALKFLHDDQPGLGKQKLQSIIKNYPEIIPHFSSNANNELVFFLLCSNDCIAKAEIVATSIQKEIIVQSHDLPRSFTAQVSDSKFASFQTNLANKYSFSATIYQNKLLIVSTCSGIAKVSKEFQAFILEECSITDTICFKKGVWRLIHSTSMEKKWSDLQEEMKSKGVTIFSPSKLSAQKPYVKVKGEVYNVEYAKKKIIELQAAVKEQQVTISRPGIGQYFFSNPQGQTMLKGIEHEANVCIEIEVSKGNTGDDEQNGTIASPAFKSIGFGTTLEMKRVNVIVGDITEFDRADVIVNAANDHLAHGAGIAAAIARKGGPKIQEESDSYIKRKGKLYEGNAVLFKSPGKLPYKAIVHAVGPRWNKGGENRRETALLKKAVRQSLDKSKSYMSIAIPAISSGIFGFPTDVCADTILQAIVEFSEMEPDAKLTEINIVIFQDNVNEFLKAAEKYLKSFQSSSKVQSSPSPLPVVAPATPISAGGERRRRIRGSAIPAFTTLTAPKVSQSTASLLPVKISHGSIIEFQEEALVNTTDTDLGFGGFVAKALLKAAGPGLQQECADCPKPAAVGSVTTTGGHNLTSKHVLHVVLPDYDKNAEMVLRQVVQKCLEECTRLKVKSLSMPSIGAGNLKYPDEIVAKVLMEETASFFQKNEGETSLQLVHFVIFEKKIYDEFQKFYRNLSSPANNLPVASPSPSLSSSHFRQQQHSTTPQYSDDSKCTFSLPHNLSLELLQGDISGDDSDAIVNTTQEDLKLIGSGVSAALLKKGGKALQDACDEAVSRGQRATEGKVVATKATGSLQCKEVFHIAFYKGKNLTKTVQSCLELAETRRFHSISFPAIGTGVHAYPAADAAKAIADALKRFIASKPKHVKTIRIILYQPHVHKEFVTAFNSIGESSGGLLSYLYSGVTKAVKSLFANSNDDDEEMEVKKTTVDRSDDEEMEVTTTSVDRNDNEDVAAMLAGLSLDSEVTLHIYGEKETMVGRAETKLLATINTTFTDDEITDPSITAFSDDTVRELEALAKQHHVDVEIDRDQVLHSVKFHGFVQDVLLVKDKVRIATSSITQKQLNKAAAEAVSKNVSWIRLNSNEEEEEYGVELNYEIEQAYQSKKIFDATDDNFYINFDKMEERDKITNKTAIVKRLDLTKVQEQPEYWDPMPKDSQGKEKHFHFVTLPSNNSEYQTVEAAFNKTMVGMYRQIVSIQRLQNPALYKLYALKKREMEKHNPPGEKQLWHGTSPDTLAKINTRGFDRSFAGKNATYYGKGVYFARDASFSHGYTSPDANGQRHMYYTQVLVGEYTVGNGGMIVPPAKNPQDDPNILFDATVDNISNPTIFVVYQDAQNYPAYVVNYQ